jgi:hypothetical protein
VTEVRRATVSYPGGLVARYRWGGPASGPEVFASSEGSGDLVDHADLAGPGTERMCRAEIRVEGPLGTWTSRFASPVFDEPAGLLWDSEALLMVRYGFRVYALGSRTGELRWSYLAGTPTIAVLGSTRIPHVLVQSEVETVALDAVGDVRWRVAHGEVIASAELLASQLALTSYGGDVALLDPLSGRTVPR